MEVFLLTGWNLHDATLYFSHSVPDLPTTIVPVRAVCCSFYPGPELPCLCALLLPIPWLTTSFPPFFLLHSRLPVAFFPAPPHGACSFPSGTCQRCLSAASQPIDFSHSLGYEAIELSLAFVFKFRLNCITLGKLLFVPQVSPV